MPTYDFDGKVAFVTGAAHGQGRSHAVKYAENGADVVAMDIGENMETVPYDLGTVDELEKTVEMVENEGQSGLAVQGDVSVEADVERAVSKALDEFGHIDFLANNAGILTLSELTVMDEEMWDEMIDVTVKGVWLCSKHVGQHFIERGDGGKIVSTSSLMGLTAYPVIGHYTAAKHGVMGLTKSLALELAEHDVNVNAVNPTFVGTPMVQGTVEAYGEEALEELTEPGGETNMFEPGEPIDPVDISEAYLWLSSDAARYVTGIGLPVAAGYTAK